MGDSPESGVRNSIASREDDSVEKLSAFLGEDAIDADPRGVRNGLYDIRKIGKSGNSGKGTFT
jgi:hypothetical protein